VLLGCLNLTRSALVSRSYTPQIPAALGYGASGSPPKIPGGASLVFQVCAGQSALAHCLRDKGGADSDSHPSRWSCCPSARHPSEGPQTRESRDADKACWHD
jgi:hypothetical protein